MKPLDTEFEELLREALSESISGPISEDADLHSLGLDSMALVSLVLGLEETYGVTFPVEGMTYETFSTVRSLWNCVENLRLDAQG